MSGFLQKEPLSPNAKRLPTIGPHPDEIVLPMRQARSKPVNFQYLSASNTHTIDTMDYFWNFNPTKSTIKMIVGKTLSEGLGTIVVELESGRQFKLTDVQYCPHFEFNSFSLGKAESEGFRTRLGDYFDIVAIFPGSDPELIGTIDDNGHHMPLKVLLPPRPVTSYP